MGKDLAEGLLRAENKFYSENYTLAKGPSPMVDVTPREIYDANYIDLNEEIARMDFRDEDTLQAVKTFKIFTECQPATFDPEPTPLPTTKWEKFKHRTARIWDNETTRVFIKAGGAFAGVALVTYSTIHKDHVIERQAIAQANQRPS